MTDSLVLPCRMMDPVVLQYGKGQLTGFLADPNAVLDVVSDISLTFLLTLHYAHANCLRSGTSGHGGERNGGSNGETWIDIQPWNAHLPDHFICREPTGDPRPG